MARHIDFEAIENFRDFGGYATACGRGVVAGRFFRSGHHAAATEADLARLRGLGVAAVVDLRHPAEREREPSRRWQGFDARVIENDIGSDAPDWVASLDGQDLTAEWFFRNGLHHYRQNPFEARHLALFRHFLHAVSEPEGAVVVHCAAGKDRTGLACAIFHRLAGVHHDDMIADYLLTNDESRMDRKVTTTGAWLEGVIGRRPPEDALRVACSVHPAYLDAAFAAIEDGCGSFENYVEGALGLDAEAQARLRERVLA